MSIAAGFIVIEKHLTQSLCQNWKIHVCPNDETIIVTLETKLELVGEETGDFLIIYIRKKLSVLLGVNLGVKIPKWQLSFPLQRYIKSQLISHQLCSLITKPMYFYCLQVFDTKSATFFLFQSYVIWENSHLDSSFTFIGVVDSRMASGFRKVKWMLILFQHYHLAINSLVTSVITLSHYASGSTTLFNLPTPDLSTLLLFGFTLF